MKQKFFKLTLFLAIFPFYGFSQEFTEKSFINKLQLISDKEDETAKSLFQIMLKTQEFLNTRLSRIPSDAPLVTLKFDGMPPTQKSFRTIYFKRSEIATMNSFEIIHPIMSSLIHRTLVSLGSIEVKPPPDWLVAAYIHQLIIGDSLYSKEKYPLTRLAIMNKKYPDLENLINAPAPTAESYWLYAIYAEQTAVFHRGILYLKDGRNKLLNYLLERRESSILEKLSINFEEFKTPRTRKNWFKQTSNRICYDIINPLSIKEIEEKINNLLTITVARPGGQGLQTTTLSLEEISEDNSRTVDIVYLTHLERNIIELSLNSPATVREAFTPILQSIALLKNRDIEKFKVELKKAKANLQEAITKQIKINEYLNTLEKSKSAMQVHYSKIIQAYELAEIRWQKTFPAFHQYLNEIEQKLDSIKIE